MADDFDDGKGRKDMADFAQIMNVVNDIKGRVKDLNPVTFEALRAALANVLDAHPEVAEFANIKEIFEQLELALKEEQRVKAVIAALINDENRAAEAKRIEEEAAEKAREEIERRAEVAEVYKAFDSLRDTHVKGQDEDDKNLDAAIKALEEGREIDEETKRKLTKTPEQIEAEKRRWQHIDQTDKIADKEKKLHSDAIQKIKKLEEKVAHLPENHPERVSLANKRKYHEHHNFVADTKKAECKECYDKEKKQVEKFRCGLAIAKEKGRKDYKAFFQDRLTDLQEMHEVAPNKISERLITEETPQQTSTLLPPSESQIVKLSPQKLDTTVIASNLDGTMNKQEELAGRIQKVLSGGKDIKMQLQEVGAANPTPDPTPPVLKAKDPNKGKGGRD
ncbi:MULTISPECIES: hypothetical protein [unclassified Candidatus Tisiphia]|uniref:hypothetical protein n=1 Tax=unclassified Candidatus Tisiphia TaxID=2996318 RepID=UPI00312CB0AC